jgi:hypothetical protein
VIHALMCAAVAVIVHESGHYLAALFFGIRVKGFRVTLKGFSLVREHGAWFDCLVVCIAGPLFNLAAAWVTSDELLRTANICLALVNLLPITGSDGSHIFDCVAHIQDVRKYSTRRNGYVNSVQLDDIRRELSEGRTVYASVRTHADAERLHERLFHAGNDTSRVFISVDENLEAA